jgi:hypothetical protein
VKKDMKNKMAQAVYVPLLVVHCLLFIFMPGFLNPVLASDDSR